MGWPPPRREGGKGGGRGGVGARAGGGQAPSPAPRPSPPAPSDASEEGRGGGEEEGRGGGKKGGNKRKPAPPTLWQRLWPFGGQKAMKVVPTPQSMPPKLKKDRRRRIFLATALFFISLALILVSVYFTYPQVKIAWARPIPTQNICEVVEQDRKKMCVGVRFLHHPFGDHCIFKDFAVQNPPEEDVIVFFKQKKMGREYPCYYFSDDTRATFDAPPTDDLAVVSVATLVPILFVFFYVSWLLLLEVRKFKNPEKYLEVAEREMAKHEKRMEQFDIESQRKLAAVQGKIEREQEKRLEMTAWFAKERAERLRGAENFRDETSAKFNKIQESLSAISKELKEGGVAVTPSRARKKAHKDHKGQGKPRVRLEKEPPLRTPVKMMQKNPLKKADDAKGGRRASMIPGFGKGIFPNMG